MHGEKFKVRELRRIAALWASWAPDLTKEELKHKASLLNQLSKAERKKFRTTYLRTEG